MKIAMNLKMQLKKNTGLRTFKARLRRMARQAINLKVNFYHMVLMKRAKVLLVNFLKYVCGTKASSTAMLLFFDYICQVQYKMKERIMYRKARH